MANPPGVAGRLAGFAAAAGGKSHYATGTLVSRGNGARGSAGRPFFQPGRIRHRSGAGQVRHGAAGLHRPGAVLCPHLFHPRADRPQRNGAAPAGRGDDEHGPGAVAGNAVWGRQDAHADRAVSPGAGRPGRRPVSRRRRAAGRGRHRRGAGGAGGRVRRQRLGSGGGSGNALD